MSLYCSCITCQPCIITHIVSLLKCIITLLVVTVYIGGGRRLQVKMEALAEVWGFSCQPKCTFKGSCRLLTEDGVGRCYRWIEEEVSSWGCRLRAALQLSVRIHRRRALQICSIGLSWRSQVVVTVLSRMFRWRSFWIFLTEDKGGAWGYSCVLPAGGGRGSRMIQPLSELLFNLSSQLQTVQTDLTTLESVTSGRNRW